MTRRVTCIIPAYNGAHQLKACIEALFSSDSLEIEVLVVDNASDDASAVVARLAGACVISMEMNLGYGAGVNFGLRSSRSDYVVALNQDIVVEASTLRTLVETVEAELVLGREVLAAPALTNSSGELAETAHRLPTLFSSVLSLLISETIARDRNNRGVDRRSGVEEWVSAATVLGRRSSWERLGGFDERYFMYVEDVDLFDRARDIGIYCRWQPETKVLHLGGTGPWPAELYAGVLRNWVLYWRSRRGRAVGLVWLAAWLGGMQRAIVYVILSLAPQTGSCRRRYSRMFFGASLSLLRSGPNPKPGPRFRPS